MHRKAAFVALLYAVGWLSTVTTADATTDVRLVEAVKELDVTTARALVASDVDVNARQPDGATAIHWAAHWGDLALTQLLIEAHAQLDLANDYGVTPLMLACENGSASVVETLLSAGANPHTQQPTGKTALMAAARTGQLASVRALLAHGATIDAQETVKGQTALMWAVSGGHVDIVRTLIVHGADVQATTNSQFTPLMFAVREGHLDLARMLMTAGADVNAKAADGTTPLIVALVRGHVDLALVLLEAGADPNADGAGYTALHWAAGKWETESALVYAQSESEWASQLGIPAERGQLDLIKALIAHGADLNAPLERLPSLTGGPGGVGLSGGFPFSAIGATAFWLAARSGDVPVMRLLVAAGANPLLSTADGTTPLSAAVGGAFGSQQVYGIDTLVSESARVKASKLALDFGADIDGANVHGHTPLHAAAISGFNQVARFLLAQGATVNSTNKVGDTPLKTAQGYGALMAIFHFKEVADTLLEAGGVARPGPPAPYDGPSRQYGEELLKALEERAVLVNEIRTVEDRMAAAPTSPYQVGLEKLRQAVDAIDERLQVYDEVTFNRYDSSAQR